MKTTLRIARTELASMFFSPIAWLLLVIFVIQAASSFFHPMKLYGFGEILGMPTTELTGIITGGGGLLMAMSRNLYLYIPLLTMGVIARERHSGSINLLLSSPVKISEIVLGKYLALMTYCALLMMVFLVFMFVGMPVIENLGYPQVLSGILGQYLLICTYAAIGLFMSCLTVHQVVAAISTLTILAVLNNISMFGQTIPYVRDITFWLDLAGKSSEMVAGLMTSKAIFYYCLISTMFLTFAILKLSSGRKIESKTKKANKYLLVIAVTFLVGYISSRPGNIAYLDVTYTQVNSLTNTSLKIIEPVKDKQWKLTSYVNLLTPNLFFIGQPNRKNAELARFKNYTRYMPHLELETILYYGETSEMMFQDTSGKTNREIAQSMAKQMDINFDEVLSPEELKKIVNLEGEGAEGFVQHLEINGKRTFLRLFADPQIYPSEREISTVFKRLLQRPLKTALLAGHQARSFHKNNEQEYQRSFVTKNNRSALINQGHEVIDADLNQPIAEDIDILVIADPRNAFSEIEKQNLSDYIARGGDLLIAGDIGRQDIINPLLEELGVELMQGQLLQKTKDYAADLIQTWASPRIEEWKNKNNFHWFQGAPITALRGVGLQYDLPSNNGFSYTPILMTSTQDDVRNRQGNVNLNEGEFAFNSQTDTKADFTLVVALTRNIAGKEQRIIVLGDADILSTGELSRRLPQAGNASFAPAVYGWLSHGVYPLSITRVAPIDNKLTIGRDGVLWLKVIFYGIVPGLVLLFGFGLLYRRKRR